MHASPANVSARFLFRVWTREGEGVGESSERLAGMERRMALLLATKQPFFDSIRDYSCTGANYERDGPIFFLLLNRIMRVINGEDAKLFLLMIYRGSLY